MELLLGIAIGAAFSKFWLSCWSYVSPYMPWNKKQPPAPPTVAETPAAETPPANPHR